MNLLLIYFEYFKTGLFAIGGGLASLPFLYQIAEKYQWFFSYQIPDMLAVAQLIPGAIGVNLAAYIGRQGGGIAGAFLAALGYVTAPVIIICIIANMYKQFKENTVVKAVFSGMSPAAAGLLAAAGSSVMLPFIYNEKAADILHAVNVKYAVILLIFYILMTKTKKAPFLFIVLGAITGIVFKL
ncbi:hypothetical protein AGMMS50212_12810 [Spirochaetia bacterium]|nr:hypothetical protein AGMMS50212_12810 [Spirochaetia bacterium]